jgi:hypothetical protein
MHWGHVQHLVELPYGHLAPLSNDVLVVLIRVGWLKVTKAFLKY